jgi:hypothetical protein
MGSFASSCDEYVYLNALDPVEVVTTCALCGQDLFGYLGPSDIRQHCARCQIIWLCGAAQDPADVLAPDVAAWLKTPKTRRLRRDGYIDLGIGPVTVQFQTHHCPVCRHKLEVPKICLCIRHCDALWVSCKRCRVTMDIDR